MTSKFREFFGGSGNLNGKAPDIAMSPGLNWGIAGSAASLTRSANRVTSTSNVNTNDAGSEEYGNRIGTTYAGALTTGTVSIKFTTGPSVGANADGHRGFSLILGYGTAGNNIEIYASGNTSGVWTLGLDGSSTGITVAANTTYTGVFTFSSGSQSITMFGQTFVGEYRR